MKEIKLSEWLRKIETHSNLERAIHKKRQINSILRIVDESLMEIHDLSVSKKLRTKFEVLNTSIVESDFTIPVTQLEGLSDILREIITNITSPNHLPRTVNIQKLRSELSKYEGKDYILVCDLEMTVPYFESENFCTEIIEIGIVALDSDFNQIDKFEALVRPTVNQELSNLCTKITKITDSMLIDAPRYPEAHESMVQFISKYAHSAIFAQYGSGDHHHIVKDCNTHGIPLGFDLQVCNVKQLITTGKLVGRKQRGLEKALSTCNIKRHGQAHRALNDAIDTANLLEHALAKLQPAN